MRKTPWMMLASYIAAVSALAGTLAANLENGPISPSLVSIAVGAVLSSVLITLLFTRIAPPSPHNVAFVGFQKSGKTTLLITMFNELMLFRVSGVSARLRGEKTIKRVTSYMEKIRLRQAVGPTTQRSQFPYEVNITRGRFLGRSFKMSFADFPGEKSEEYVSGLPEQQSEGHDYAANKESEDYRSVVASIVKKRAPYHQIDDTALFDRDFFRWVLECDALVFVVDIAQYLMDKAHSQPSPMASNYVVEVSQAYMRTWSYILDARDQAGEARAPVVVLAFTKSDLFDVDSHGAAADSLETMMATAGFEEPLPEVREISRVKFEEGKKQCEEDFYDLLQFLRGHSRRFHSVYTSSFALMDGQRLGVEKVFKAVLPIAFR